MDPLSITTAVLSIVQTCFSTAGTLNDIRSRYINAPATITSIHSETTVISASLAQLQRLLANNDSFTTLRNRPELAPAFDCSLIGCMTLFSSLDDELARVSKSARPGGFNWRGKVRVVWNYDKLRSLLEDLRGQQTALNTLVHLVQVESIAEMRRQLENSRGTFENTAERTRTLRDSHPNIKVPASICSTDSRKSDDIMSITSSVSERVFDFDSVIVNSTVYRRMLAQAMARSRIDADKAGNSLDSSDDRTVLPEDREVAADRALEQSASAGLANHESGNARTSQTQTKVFVSWREDKPPGQKPPRCRECRDWLLGSRVRAMGYSFHQDCFKCTDCDEVFATRYFLFQEETGNTVPLCETDYFRRLNLLCAMCHSALRESYIHAQGDRKYHPEHFQCDTCRSAFRAEDTFYEHENCFYCYEHFLEVAHRCLGCNTPILDQYCEVFERRKNAKSPPTIRRWHPECYTSQATTNKKDVLKELYM